MSHPRANDIEYIRDLVRKIAPGQRLAVFEEMFRQYDAGALLIGTPFTGADRVLEGIVGSSYEYGYTRDHQSGVIEFFRLEQPLNDSRRTYVSPDRRHYYVKSGIYYHPKDS